MTSSNGSIFRVTGILYGEFTGHRWIPLTKASDEELSYFLWSVPEQTVEQTITGDLRRHRAHHDVTVMSLGTSSIEWYVGISLDNGLVPSSTKSSP